MSQTAPEDVTASVPALDHLRDRTGTAMCGDPATQEHLFDWGDEPANLCRHCSELYARRAWGRM